MDEWVVKPQRERSSAGSMYGGHWSLSWKLCFIFSERKYNTSIILPNAKHYLISLGLKSKMIVSMPEVCQKMGRTMFRVMEMGKFFYERQYTTVSKFTRAKNSI
jgi:hypothetical protein